MDEDGFWDRDALHWSNIIVQPNDKLSMITKGSGAERCIDLVRMIFLNTSDGVRNLIRRAQEEVSNETNWSEQTIATWRSTFHVQLPDIELINQQILEASLATEDELSEEDKETQETIEQLGIEDVELSDEITDLSDEIEEENG